MCLNLKFKVKLKKKNGIMTKILHVSQILLNRFYFATTTDIATPSNNDQYLYFTIDDCVNYPSIQTYFGPPCLGIYTHAQTHFNKILKMFIN